MGSLELQASPDLATIEWHGISWAACHRRARSLQRRIVQAVQAGAWRKVKRLSYLLVHSFAARALAVKRVTENHGKKTPGMDGEPWETPEQKAAAVEWDDYFQRRDRQLALQASSRFRANVLTRQNGCCPVCQQVIQCEEDLELHHRDGNHQNNRIGNLVLLHPNCHCQLRYAPERRTELARLARGVGHA